MIDLDRLHQDAHRRHVGKTYRMLVGVAQQADFGVDSVAVLAARGHTQRLRTTLASIAREMGYRVVMRGSTVVQVDDMVVHFMADEDRATGIHHLFVDHWVKDA